MEYGKLIELLNESKPLEKGYEYKAKNGLVYLVYCNQLEGDEYTDYTMRIISKDFGFIQRLVDNDKIDLLNLTCMNTRYTEILDSDFSWEDRIVMILAIQDNPIEFLVSILK